jgi:hypothetical protein
MTKVMTMKTTQVAEPTRRGFHAALLMLALLSAATAQAHQLWIGASNYVLKYPGARPGPVTTTAFVTFGHKLPIEEPLDDARFGGLYLVSGDSAPRRLETTPAGFRSVQLKFDRPGAHWLSSVNAPIFSTQMKDAQGVITYARVPKDQAPAGVNVVDATQIYDFAKTLIFVAGTGVESQASAVVTKPLGHTLELVPARNPAALAKGDTLSVQVLFRGKPYVEEPIEIVAEHVAGAFIGKPGKWVGETDKGGRVNVPLELAGPWQLLATVMDAPPVELKAKANQVRYRATLMFEVPGANYSQ